MEKETTKLRSKEEIVKEKEQINKQIEKIEEELANQNNSAGEFAPKKGDSEAERQAKEELGAELYQKSKDGNIKLQELRERMFDLDGELSKPPIPTPAPEEEKKAPEEAPAPANEASSISPSPKVPARARTKQKPSKATVVAQPAPSATTAPQVDDTESEATVASPIPVAEKPIEATSPDFEGMSTWDEFNEKLLSSSPFFVQSRTGGRRLYNPKQLEDPLKEMNVELKKLAAGEQSMQEFREAIGKILIPIEEKTSFKLISTLKNLLDKKAILIMPREKRSPKKHGSRKTDSKKPVVEDLITNIRKNNEKSKIPPKIKARTAEELAEEKAKQIDPSILLPRVNELLTKMQSAEKNHSTIKTTKQDPNAEIFIAARLKQLNRIKAYLEAKNAQQNDPTINLPKLDPETAIYAGDLNSLIELQNVSEEEFAEVVNSPHEHNYLRLLDRKRVAVNRSEDDERALSILQSRVSLLIKKMEKAQELGTDDPEIKEFVDSKVEELHRIEAYLIAKEKGYDTENVNLIRPEDIHLFNKIKNLADKELEDFLLFRISGPKKPNESKKKEPKTKTPPENIPEEKQESKKNPEKIDPSSQERQTVLDRIALIQHFLKTIQEKLKEIEDTIARVVDKEEGDRDMARSLRKARASKIEKLKAQEAEQLERLAKAEAELAALDKKDTPKEEEPKSNNETLQEEREKMERTKRIKEAANFDELYTLLDELKEVQGSHTVFSAAILKSYIADLRTKDSVIRIEDIPPTYGLREKVAELLYAEKGTSPEQGSLDKLEDELKKARDSYLTEYSDYLKAQKQASGLNKIWQALKSPFSKKEEAVPPASLVEAKKAYTEAVTALGQAMFDARKGSLEKLSEEGGVLSEDEMGFLLEEFNTDKRNDPKHTKEYYEKHEKDIRAGKISEAERDLLLRNFRNGKLLKYMLNEDEFFNQKCVENFSSKEKDLNKNIYERVMDSYASMSPGKKMLTGLGISLVGVAGGYVLGGTAVGVSLPVLAAYRIFSWGVSSLAIIGTDKAIETYWKDKSGERYEKAIVDIRNAFGGGEKDIKETYHKLQESKGTRDDEKRKWNRNKLLAMAAIGVATNIGSSRALSHLHLGGAEHFNHPTHARGGSPAPSPDAGHIPPPAGGPSHELVGSGHGSGAMAAEHVSSQGHGTPHLTGGHHERGHSLIHKKYHHLPEHIKVNWRPNAIDHTPTHEAYQHIDKTLRSHPIYSAQSTARKHFIANTLLRDSHKYGQAGIPREHIVKVCEQTRGYSSVWEENYQRWLHRNEIHAWKYPTRSTFINPNGPPPRPYFVPRPRGRF